MVKVIAILWLRQIKRYVRSKARLFSSIGQPLLFLVALWFGFGPIFARAGGGDYLEFLAPGIIAMSVLFSAMFMGIEVIWDRQFGFLKETLVAPVSRLEIMVGRTLGGATVAVAQGIVIFLVTLLMGFRPDAAMLPVALLFLFMIGTLFTALGTAIASRMEDMHAFPVIMNFIIMPLFFLSGAIFPLDGLPRTVALLTKVNPLTYGVDGLRGALTGVSHLGIGLDLLVLACCVVAVFVTGAALFSSIEA